MHTISTLLLLATLATASPLAAEEAATPLAGFEFYIGRWALPRDSDFLKKYPYYANRIGFEWEWGPAKWMVRSFESYAIGRRDEAVSQGIISFDPARGRIVYLESQTRNHFLFQGEYTTGPGNRLERVYDVSYPEGYNLPEPEMPGLVRRYREIFTPTGPDTVDVQLDVYDFAAGGWRPFGRAGGTYKLERKAPASEVARLSADALPDIPDEAMRRLEHALGRWKVEAEMLAPDGSVARTVEWENHAEWIIDGRVVLLTHDAPALGVLSKTMLFYSHDDGTFKLVDVNQKGELWILSGGLDEFVITSEPRPIDGGGEMIVRFSHEDVDPDTFLAHMEYSTDGGTTWIRGQKQTITRLD